MIASRRTLLSAGLGLAAAAGAARQAGATARLPAAVLIANPGADQTAALQAAIDDAAARGVPLDLPAGTFSIKALTLRPGLKLSGAMGLTTLKFIGSGRFIMGQSAPGMTLANLTIDGGMNPLDPAQAAALLVFTACPDLTLSGLRLINGNGSGIALTNCTGRISDCTINQMAQAAIAALDSTFTISSNTISACGNNGILVWRSKPAEDGSQVTGNRISGIRADGGGSSLLEMSSVGGILYGVSPTINL